MKDITEKKLESSISLNAEGTSCHIYLTKIHNNFGFPISLTREQQYRPTKSGKLLQYL